MRTDSPGKAKAGRAAPRRKGPREDLRRSAERTLKREAPGGRQALSPGDCQRVIHELQVHQIELEMQNEELQEARKIAEMIQEKYIALYDFAPVGYLGLDRGGKILEMNLTGSTLLGRPRGHVVGRRFQAFLTQESIPVFRDFSSDVLWSGERRACEVGLPSDGGGTRFFRLEGIPFHTGNGEEQIQAAMMEVTDRRLAEEALRASLTEKEVLLREIHHRVKNNLQLIASLLEMTRSRTDDPMAVTILDEVGMKLKTMAQIHTKVYETQRYDRVDLGEQIGDQVKSLSQVYASGDRRIMTSAELDSVTLPIDRAMPFALVVNELLSNAYKHAFMGRKQGKVEVSLGRKNDRIQLVIRDDGVGMPPGFDAVRSDTLGLKLVRTILQQQLKGTLRYGRARGTEVIVEVPCEDG